MAETAAERSDRHGAVTHVARQLGIGPESLRLWVRQAEIDRGTRAGLTSEERERIKTLERENRELRRANEILKSAARFLRGGARPPLAAMARYIDKQRGSYGIEPICRTLQVAPSSYYAAKVRPPSARTVRDAELSTENIRIHAEHFSVYGVRKAWRVLRREGIPIGRDHVGRLMRVLGLAGATRTKRIRTTIVAPVSQRPADLVERVFSAAAPNRLWVADLTYVWTRTGLVYAAFVVDAFSRAIVGWRVSVSLHAELARDVLEMALWARGADHPDLVHHSDRGVQTRFKGLSQHCPVRPSVVLRRGPRRVSSSRGSCVAGC